MNTMDLDRTYIAETYRRFPIELTEGHGSILKDAQGREYIDLGSRIAVNIFGMNDEIWKQAVIAADQSGAACFQSVLYRPPGKAGGAIMPAHGHEKGLFCQLRSRG